MSIKIERIESAMVREISYLLANEVKDPDIRFVTVTACHVTNDLSFAKVYVTVFDLAKKDSTMKSLKNASGFLRSKLCDRIDIRHMPELEFVYDESIDYGKKIEDIIEKINEKN